MIARCENCGAALRMLAEATSARCEYCGVTSSVGTPSKGAPRLRIDPAPPIRFVNVDAMLNGYVLTTIGGVMVVVGVILAVTKGVELLILTGIGTLLVAVGAVFLHATSKERRQEREQQWLRDNGLAGRATVESIRAGQTRRATLGLKIELAGRTEFRVDHVTTVPELLVPRLVQGLCVPVIVHPVAQDQIELQWHLL
jgi:hypothetical protein